MSHIVLNGVNSNTVAGLLISSLPPISKPMIRTQIDLIDGRDGDIVTKLGYSAYDKVVEIGLRGTFDINAVIAYFDSEGTVVFSDEPDKYYRYQILEQIDFERLLRFRTAKVTFHVQPFKYPVSETAINEETTYKTGSGDYVSFSDGVDGGLINALTVNIRPVQDGSGDPSASNIRAINGWTAATVRRTGKNLITARTFTKSGTNYISAPIYVNSNMFPLRFSKLNNNYNKRIYAYKKDGTTIGANSGSGSAAFTVAAKTAFSASVSGATYDYDEIDFLRIRYYNVSGNPDVSVFEDLETQAELGSAATGYSAYSGESASFDWSALAGTIYGGTLDCATGLLTVKWGYIAAYAGETLTGEWVSDRDVYSAGGTPTTGAAVAYELDEADYTTYQLDPVSLHTVEGINNVFADCGSVELSYQDGNTITVQNAGNTYAMPTITLRGAGNVELYMNGVQALSVALGDTSYITLDVEEMNAYQGSLFANRLVTGDYNNLRLLAGNNVFKWVGNVTEVEISNYSRWL